MASHNFFNFLYIAIIIVGAIAMTLSFVLNAKIKSKREHDMEIFFIAIFAYTVIDFITYYCLFEIATTTVIFALITISDVLAIGMLATWLNLISVMAGRDKTLTPKLIYGFTVAYIIVQESASVVYGQFDGKSIIVQNIIGKYLLEVMCIIFTVTFIAMGIMCLAAMLKKEKPRYIELVLVITFILYNVWIGYWDLDVWFFNSTSFMQTYAIDPILFIYVLLSVLMMIYFLRQDPLKLGREEIVSQVSLDKLSEKYQLSAREREILSCINEGLSNPEIAKTLFISENTVKRHVNNVLKKTGAKNRHELLYMLSTIS